MMTIPPEVERINQFLVSQFGIETTSGDSIWRIVWSDDQFEKRLMDVTDEGLHLLHPEVREVPKYRQWIQHKWVLERLVIVPDYQTRELAGIKKSYEPLWVFEDKHGNPLPPNADVCKFVIDTVYAAQGKTSLAKYTDPDADGANGVEAKRERIKNIEAGMGEDDSEIADRLVHKEGIVVPNSYNHTKES